MKEIFESLLRVCLLAVAVVISAAGSSTIAQSPIATPQENRGLGIDQSRSTNTSQSDQSKSKEAKPELVLQTGYNIFMGATRLVFSPDGRLLATSAFRSSTIKLWETATGRELRDLSTGGQNSTGISPFIAFSSDNRLLAADAGNNSVKVWDVITGREVQTLSGPQTSFMAALGVSFIAFSTDGKKLVTVSEAIHVWDTASWREIKTLDTTSLNASGFTGGEGAMALSPDGSQLARVDTNGSKTQIKFLDLNTGQEVRSIELPYRQIDSLELCFTPVGRLVAAGIVEKKLKVWDVTTRQSERGLGSTAKDYSLIRLSHDGRLLALSEGYTVKLWELSASRELPTLNVPNTGAYLGTGEAFVNFSDDGNKIATGGFGTQTLLWETETGKQVQQMKGRSNMAYAVAFSADGNQLSAGGRTRWDLRTGRGLRLTAAPSDKLFGMPSPDGKLVAMFAPNDAAITILETPSGRQLQTLAGPNGEGVERVYFSPDSRRLVSIYMEAQGSQRTVRTAPPQNQIKIWEITSGHELQTLALGSSPSEVAFSADSRVLATIGTQGEVALWDVATGARLRDLTTSPMG